MEPQRLLPGDPTLVENIVNYLKAEGIFDEFRHECLADVDTKSSCQNLSQRVDGYASKFLANETWHPDMNKNELRNKLRRHIDESGMLAVGADHVVEQVINPKIHQLFLPKIIEVVHQYMREQNEILNKKIEATSSDYNLIENVSDATDSSKSKTPLSDPIADILSFSSSKTKSTLSSTHGKTDNILQKIVDAPKLEKKKEEKSSPILEKSNLESPVENPVISPVTEVKPQPEKEKEKIKKEEQEVSLEVQKKVIKEEVKPEKKKVEDTKLQGSEIKTPLEESKTTYLSAKPNVSAKKDDKEKQKSKSVTPQKTSSEIKKPKKESDKSSEKPIKSKTLKPSKELPSPSKSVSLTKSASKDEKIVEVSKSKSSDTSSSKTSESSLKKSSSDKKDVSSSKHKTHKDKADKNKISKSSDKSEQSFLPESSNNDKTLKNIHYSSSYDSSQGSDQEKSSSSSSKKERQKHFSKHAKKEKSEKDSDSSCKASSLKKRSKEDDEKESPSKKLKNEKNASHEKLKETINLGEAAKISSRSNSFGSTSSISSASNASKENSVSNSEEVLENSEKNKKKKQAKDKEPCHTSKTLPPPPPPPPPSSSLSCELTSSAEMSSMEDTQSSSDSEDSVSEELSEQSSSDSELESKESVLSTLNENVLNSSTDDINAFYDIFLYSSSSSEFEGYGLSPEKKNTENVLEKINESDVSVSSVHTSDLSSFDDELSDDDFVFNEESQKGVKKRLTLKDAQDIIQKRKDFLQSIANKTNSVENKLNDDSASVKKRCEQRSSSLLSSEDESSPSAPTRSLRRERKLNPRYASSEYTSIFNSRKETFITKQCSPYVKNQTPLSSPVTEKKHKKEISEKDKTLKKNLSESKNDLSDYDNVDKSVKSKKKASASENIEEKEFSENYEMSSSDEMSSIMDNRKLLYENDKNMSDSCSDQLKHKFKFRAQNSSNYNINSYPIKRKLKYSESAPAKRSCSRGSVDSSSSECVPNENKPFNNEKLSLSEEKLIRDGDVKGSNLTDTIKKDLFNKQRINNNGDILGQKDIFSKNSRGKAISATEKKTAETENSKELNAL